MSGPIVYFRYVDALEQRLEKMEKLLTMVRTNILILITILNGPGSLLPMVISLKNSEVCPRIRLSGRQGHPSTLLLLFLDHTELKHLPLMMMIRLLVAILRKTLIRELW